MWRRQWVTVIFIVHGFIFQGRTCASVNVDSQGELIENYIEDPEYLEDVEFVDALHNDYHEEDIPKAEDLTDENLEDIIYVYI